jgi:SAM-dependent methyltransferase
VEQRAYEQLYRLEDRHWWFRGRRAVIWAMLRRAGLGAMPRILDAGCGTGRNLLEYGRLGTAIGIDPSPRAVAFCRQRGLRDVELGGLEALPFADGRFDLMLACDVLEHIDDDAGALRELRRVAAPGARLLATVPAYAWLWSPHDDSHHHRRRYTLAQLGDRIVGAGWTVRTATYFNTLLLPPIAAARALTRRRAARRSDYELTPGPLDRWLHLPMSAEAKLIGSGISLPAGVSIGMVCVAP